LPSNLAEVKAQLADLNAKLKLTNDNVKDAKATLTEYMILLNRLNLPYGVDRIVNELTRLKMTVDLLIRGFNLLNVVSGPWGWARAVGTFAVAGLSGYSIWETITGV
jgi:hypothetical protein